MMQTQQESDKVLTCRDCEESFTITIAEQQFFRERGLHEPKRCKSCRDARRSEKESRRS